MRKTFYLHLQDLLAKNEKVVALLGDIGVFSFARSFRDFPTRTYNFGIMEQTMIGAAAGMAKKGLIPFVHSIAPFVTERPYEQLKLNFGYEDINAFIVSVGNSYDYSGLGCTHQCPNDLRIVSSIPNFKVFCAGNPVDVKRIIDENIDTQGPKYIRLSEFSNDFEDLDHNEFSFLRSSKNGACLIVGNAVKSFRALISANIDCSFFYTNRVSDFSVDNFFGDFLSSECRRKITVIEPCYDCGLLSEIALAVEGLESLHSISIPKKFIDIYGTKGDLDFDLGLDDASIIQKLISIYGTKI